MLDAYFVHARGSSKSAIVLRIYAGLYPEYEIVLDPQVSMRKVFRYSPVRSIYGKAYDGWDIDNPRRSLTNYISRAKKIPFKKQEFEIPESTFNDLVDRQKGLVRTTCGNELLRNSKGDQVVTLDVSTYELIIDSGRGRSAVLNTNGDDVISPNPDLLKWATDVLKLAPPSN